MKNKLITRMAILFCLTLLGFSGRTQTTSLVVGTVKSGAGTITNLTDATHVLIANLPDGSSVSDLKVEYSENESKYYLTGKVSGNAVSSVAVQLGQSGNTLTAFAGPGVEYTCNGFNCSDCRISFKGGPHCTCFKIVENPYRCDMTSKYTIGL